MSASKSRETGYWGHDTLCYITKQAVLEVCIYPTPPPSEDVTQSKFLYGVKLIESFLKNP